MDDNKIDQDCKFYYTSSCAKRYCMFRHEPAALESYTTCSFWKNGKCRKDHCPYRHMELKRSDIPCYWETQPGGCQKDDCPFRHSDGEDEDFQRPERVEDVRRQNTRPAPGARNNVPIIASTRRPQTHTQTALIRAVSVENKKGEKLLKKKLKDMEKKLKKRDAQKEKELKNLQEELDAQASFSLQVLQDELEASVNASTTCMSATEEIIRHVGSTMREEFECKICFELFITPMTVNCSHTFCEYCINKWRAHSRGCPICRQTVTMQTRARAIENFIEKMVSDLSHDLQQRRMNLVAARLDGLK